MKLFNRNRIRRFSPLLVLAALVACVALCGNSGRALSAATVPATAPDGFGAFDQPRVFAQYPDSINGYKVRVMMLPSYRTWRGSCRAVLNFSNAEESYNIVHDGWRDSLFYDEDTEAVRTLPKEVLTLAYRKPPVPSGEAFTLDIFAGMPFVFHDIDFDGKDELILNFFSQGQRWTNAYEVAEMQPDRLYSIYRKEPFTSMDDWTIIDPAAKTITLCVYEGSGVEFHTVYRVRTEDYFTTVKNEYTDQVSNWGADDYAEPAYRRIFPCEQNDTTRWMPLKNK